jgi:hypothetical protein
MAGKHEITRGDIMAMEDYARERKDRRAALVGQKKLRRMEVGPVCTFHFENYDTMWAQIHEMLFIEKGGAEQLADELAAYNPLVPKGRELVATVMFEIDEPKRREAFLARLGGVEETAFLRFAGETVTGRPEADVDRTSAAGKASAVQFLHFPFTGDQVEKFTAPGTQVIIGFGHPQYSHMAVMPEDVRAALGQDFD